MMGETKKDRIQLLVRRFFLFLTDTFLLNACVYLSLIMRFDVGIVSIEPQYISNYVENMLPYTIMSLLIFWLFRLYHSLWQYASIAEVYRIAEACIIVEVVHFLSNKIAGNMLPRSCYFNAAIYLIIAICASRFMYRMIRTVLNKYRNIKTSNNVMIIGAGEATNVIMREIQNSSYLAIPIAVIIYLLPYPCNKESSLLLIISFSGLILSSIDSSTLYVANINTATDINI